MTIRAGVAGAGVFGGYHAKKYTEAEDANLTAIFDADLERAMMAAEIHDCAATTDYGRFLDQVDVLTIAAPASVHFDLARDALKAGKHVLVEKPIALDMDDAATLIALATEKGLTLQVGHQERYVFEAFGLLDRAAPREVHSRRLNRFSGRAMDVSVVFDLMIHDLDLLNQVTQGDVTSLSATGKSVHGDKSDHTETEIAFTNGTRASLAASRLQEEPVRDMRLVYDDGEVHIDFLKREIKNTTGTRLALDFSAQEAPLAFKDPLAFGTQSFLKAVAKKTTPIVDGAAGRAALDLALRIEHAAEKK